MRTHFAVLSALYIGTAVIELFIAVLAMMTIAGGGLLSGDLTAIGVTWTVSLFVGGFLGIMAFPSLIGGLALYYRKSWARVLMIILGFVNLFLFIPIGALLGIYTLWVMFKDEAEEELARAPNLKATVSYPGH